jgi:hypothetical protein
VSDSGQGHPPQNPYAGQPPSGEQPYSDQSAGERPFGQPPAPQGPDSTDSPYGQAPAPNPYGPPPAANPYAAPPPTQSPYGQPPAENPYGQPAQPQQPYASPYPPAVAGGPLGDGLDMYGRPLGNDSRPGTVTAAGWITLIFSALTGVLYLFATVALLVAKDSVIDEMNRLILEDGMSSDFDAEDVYGILVVVLVVFTAWCVVACMLAVFAMRRSNVSRILLVISSCVAGLLSLFAITSVVSAIWLVACVAVVVLLFTGGAGDWYARRRRY